MRALLLSLLFGMFPFVAAAQADAGVRAIDPAAPEDHEESSAAEDADVEDSDDAEDDSEAHDPEVDDPDADDADSDDSDDADLDDEDLDDEDLDDEDLDGEAPEPPHWTDERAAAWVTFIGSFLIGVGGGITLAVGVDDVNTVENAASGATWARVEEAYDRAPLMTGLGAALLSVGAAGTLLGAILLGVYGEGGTWVAVSVLPSGLRLSGTF